MTGSAIRDVCVVAALIAGLSGCAPEGAEPDAPQDTASLIAGLDDADARVREASARGLSSRHPEAAAAVPVLLDRLDDRDQGVRSAAQETLVRLGAAAFESVVRRIERGDEDFLAWFNGCASQALDAGPSLMPVDPLGWMNSPRRAPNLEATTSALALAPLDDAYPWPLEMLSALTRQSSGEDQSAAQDALALLGRFSAAKRLGGDAERMWELQSPDLEVVHATLVAREAPTRDAVVALTARLGPVGGVWARSVRQQVSSPDARSRIEWVAGSVWVRDHSWEPSAVELLRDLPAEVDAATRELARLGDIDAAAERVAGLKEPELYSWPDELIRAGCRHPRVLEAAVSEVRLNDGGPLIAAMWNELDLPRQTLLDAIRSGNRDVRHFDAFVLDATEFVLVGAPPLLESTLSALRKRGEIGPRTLAQLPVVPASAIPAIEDRLSRPRDCRFRSFEYLTRALLKCEGPWRTERLAATVERALSESLARETPPLAGGGIDIGAEWDVIDGVGAPAIRLLGAIGPPAKAALPLLREIESKNADLLLRSRARWAIRAIQAK